MRDIMLDFGDGEWERHILTVDKMLEVIRAYISRFRRVEEGLLQTRRRYVDVVRLGKPVDNAPSRPHPDMPAWQMAFHLIDATIDGMHSRDVYMALRDAGYDIMRSSVTSMLSRMVNGDYLRHGPYRVKRREKDLYVSARTPDL